MTAPVYFADCNHDECIWIGEREDMDRASDGGGMPYELTRESALMLVAGGWALRLADRGTIVVPHGGDECEPEYPPEQPLTPEWARCLRDLAPELAQPTHITPSGARGQARRRAIDEGVADLDRSGLYDDLERYGVLPYEER